MSRFGQIQAVAGVRCLSMYRRKTNTSFFDDGPFGKGAGSPPPPPDVARHLPETAWFHRLLPATGKFGPAIP